MTMSPPKLAKTIIRTIVLVSVMLSATAVVVEFAVLLMIVWLRV